MRIADGWTVGDAGDANGGQRRVARIDADRPSVRVMVSVFERRTYGGAAAQGEKKMRQLATAKCALASAHGVAHKDRSYLNPDM